MFIIWKRIVTRASEIRSLRNKYSKEKLFTDPNDRNHEIITAS